MCKKNENEIKYFDWFFCKRKRIEKKKFQDRKRKIMRMIEQTKQKNEEEEIHLIDSI